MDSQASSAFSPDQLAFYKSLIEHSPHFVYVYDLSQQTNLYCNPSLLNFLGLTQEQVKNLGKDFLPHILHPEDYAFLEDASKRLDKVSEGEVILWDYRMKDHKGIWYWFHSASYIYAYSSEGHPKILVGTAYDISQKKQLEMMARTAEDKNKVLSRINETLDSFVHAVAHDLRSPLVNIRTLLAYLKEAEGEKKEQYFKVLNDAVVRLERIVESLLQVIEFGEHGHNIAKEIRFQDFLDFIQQEFQEKLKECRGTIHTDFQVDKMRYLEAFVLSFFTNLMSNAIKYHAQERDLQVHISTYQQGEFVVLQMKDNGTGIDLERHRDVIFKPFRRLSSQAEGKGIGLYLIKMMVEKNGGRIEVESRIDQGTTFKLFMKEY